MSTTVRPLPVGRPHVECEVPLRRSSDYALILADMQGLSRRLIRSVPASHRTSEETYLLQDIKRGECKVLVRALSLLTSVSSKSTLPHHRFGLPEIVRAHITRQGPALRLVTDDVLDSEDDANSAADKAVRRWMQSPTEAHRQAAVEAMEQQYAHTRLVLDLLAVSAPKGGAA